MFRALVALVAVGVIVTACGDTGGESASIKVPPHAQAVEAAYSPVAHIGEAEAAVRYVEGVQREEVGKYIAGLIAEEQAQAEAARIAAEQEAARQASMSAPAQPSGSRSSGGHSDAWWMGVAICEQGGRNDPYFGYFSFMDGSQGGKPWAEQVAAGNALLARVGSESPAWAPACVAAGYAASPGG
jgi:hypothetical protein